MNKSPLLALLLAASLALCCAACRPAFAAATDIVPQGSTLLDSFAALAHADAFGAEETPEDFLGNTFYTRGQLARLLTHLVQDDPTHLAKVQGDAASAAALHTAIESLQPELTADGVDLNDADPNPPSGTASVSGYVQPELRLRIGGDKQPGTGAIGVYRVTALGNLRPNLRYNLSASNWPEDSRRVFDNDKGPHDFSALNEAYLTLDGGRGLEVNLGRMYNRWGPGTRGATMLGDNAPAMDQVQVAFPFSLGAHIGRNFQFEQLAATFLANGTRDYFVARRIGYRFSSQWNADFQQSFLSDRSWALEFIPFPDFYTAKNAHVPQLGLFERGLDPEYKAAYNLTASYTTPDDGLRLYGQFLLHDLRSPGSNSGITPRKAAYLVGGSVRPLAGTRVTVEYIFDDPTTYSSRTIGTQWQEGRYDEIALPGGPNATEYFGRLEQKIGSKVLFVLEGRDRRRHDLSFPAPTARDVTAALTYSLDKQQSLGVTFHDYRQNPFPLSPAIPVGNGLQPSNAEGNYGQAERIKQLDLDYRFFF